MLVILDTFLRSLHTGSLGKMIKGIFVALLLYLCTVGVYCQTGDNATDVFTDLGTETTFNDTAVDNTTAVDVEIMSAWVECLVESAGNETSDDNSILSILLSWCRNYKKVIPCLKKTIRGSSEIHPLDFFISLNFNPGTMKKKSRAICRQLNGFFLPDHHLSNDLFCELTSNQTMGETCMRRFSASLEELYSTYIKGVSKKSLKPLTCRLIRATTKCLDRSLTECNQDVKQYLLSYYDLFASKKCTYKPSGPAVNEMAQHMVTTKCDKESSKLAKMEGPAPTEKYDQVVRGMRADCQTFEDRFKCYERELKTAEHFWDRWLKHTFHLQNAIDGHREMCARIENIIAQLTPECFNQSQHGIMKCENTFIARADFIRAVETEKNLTDTDMADMTCSCTVEKAACYKKAFASCDVDLAEVMSQNIISMLPTECRNAAVTGSDASLSSLTDKKAIDSTKAISDSASVAADVKLTGSSSPKDGAAVNKASNLFYLLLMTMAYNIT